MYKAIKMIAGEIDVVEHFSLSMDVFPSTLNHNGILFSLGTRPDFEYYEWKTAAVHTQFIVVEFIFSAVYGISDAALIQFQLIYDTLSWVQRISLRL